MTSAWVKRLERIVIPFLQGCSPTLSQPATKEFVVLVACFSYSSVKVLGKIKKGHAVAGLL